MQSAPSPSILLRLPVTVRENYVMISQNSPYAIDRGHQAGPAKLFSHVQISISHFTHFAKNSHLVGSISAHMIVGEASRLEIFPFFILNGLITRSILTANAQVFAVNRLYQSSKRASRDHSRIGLSSLRKCTSG